MRTLRLCLLGHPVVTLNGQPIVFETRKALAILVYLALSRKPVSREILGSLFWQDYSPERTMANLRRNLSSLAQSLKGEVLKIGRQAIGLQEQVEVSSDTDDFFHKVQDTRSHPHSRIEDCPGCILSLKEAIALYAGEFLAGFNLPDCPQFDEWQLIYRENVRQELIETLASLIACHSSNDEWGQAIPYAQWFVNLDPLQEPAQQTLMTVFARAGQRCAALHQYETYCQLLLEELGQAPGSEIQSLYKDIRSGDLTVSMTVKEKISSLKQPDFPSENQSDLIQQQPSPTILRTKLFIPPVRPNYVERSRIIAKIEEGVQGALTLVSAPAGFGKTTLLASWAARSSAPVGWVSLDLEDNDPARFWTYFISGLRAIQPDLGQASLDMLKSPQPQSTKAVPTALVNDVACTSHSFTLILDDYHIITSPSIQEGLTFLIEHIPPNLHLIISTRADPLLPLARLRARNQLVNVRGEDLRLTRAEIAEFMNTGMGLGLSDQEIALLEERTEGWAAGLQMAGLGIQGIGAPGSFIQSFHGTHRYILDYLTDEVFNRLPQEIENFMLQTSILERMCAPLCDYVIRGKGLREKEKETLSTLKPSPTVPLPSDEYQSMLETLDRTNLFTISLDNERHWYRYHPLFADLLSSRLKESQPEIVPVLHQRASEWFEQNGLFFEAIQHALLARDFEHAAGLIEKIALVLIANFEFVTLINWFAAFPEAFFRNHPWLCIYHAWALLLNGQMENLDALLKTTEQATEEARSSDRYEELLGNIQGIRIYINLLCGDPTRAVELASQVKNRLPNCSPVTRCIIEFVMAHAFISASDLVEAGRSFLIVSKIAQEIGNTYLAIMALGDLAGVYKIQGQLHQANNLYQEIHRLHTKSGPQPFTLPGTLEADLGELLLEWNQLEEASHHIENSIQSNLLGGNSNLLALSYLHQVRLLLAKKELSAAQEAFSKAEQVTQAYQLYPRTYQLLESWRLRLWLAQSDFGFAERWLQQLEAKAAGDQPAIGIVEEIGWLAQARGLIAFERYPEALCILEQLSRAAEDGGREGSLIEILLLQAIAYHANHNTSDAFSSLEKAVFLAEPEDYIRIFADEGKAMRVLLGEYQLQVEKKFRQTGSFAFKRILRYVIKLIDCYASELSDPENSNNSTQERSKLQTLLVKILSQREMEVFEMAMDGCTNQQIAEKLYISISTVKSHVNHIFSKIGVENRFQAMVWLKEQNMR